MKKYSPNFGHFKNSGEALLADLEPESEGHDSVTKQIEDFDNLWKKLDKDIAEKIEKVKGYPYWGHEECLDRKNYPVGAIIISLV